MAEESLVHPNNARAAPCTPPPGKTYLAIGQDFFSIQEYVLSQYNSSLHRSNRFEKEEKDSVTSKSDILPLSYFHPAATMVYTDIYELKGLDKPADYGSGIEYIQGLAEAFPESALQVGLWLNGVQGCQDVVAGKLDGQIRRLFDYVVSKLPSSLPKIFLRIGYEFDNPWFGYSEDPRLYQNAFAKLVRACEEQLSSKLCHKKIDFVWHSWAAPRKENLTLEDFYPGDYYVDWVGVSIFQQFYPWANDEESIEGNFAGGNIRQVEEVLQFAKGRNKPIMIAESTPFGGMNVANSNVAKRYSGGEGLTTNIWDLWFQKTIDLIEDYDISMWSYINCDWDSQPMWHETGFGDTRLSTSDVVMTQWWQKVLSVDSRFRLRIESCSEGLGFNGGDAVYEKAFMVRNQEESRLVERQGLEDINGGVDGMTLNSIMICAFCVLCVSALFYLITHKSKQTNKHKHHLKWSPSTWSTRQVKYGSLE